MLKFIFTYYVLDFFVVVVAIVVTWWGRKIRLRSKAKNPPKGFVKTDEVFVDPTTGIKQQVWFDPLTGKRHYEILP